MAPFWKPVPVRGTVDEPVGIGFGEMDEIEGPTGSTATYTIPKVFLSEPSALTVVPTVGTVAGAGQSPALVMVP